MSQLDWFREEVMPPVSLHGYDARAAGLAMATNFTVRTKVQQHLGGEADINTIVRRFGVTGEVPPGVGAGVYGDFTGMGDLESITDVREMLERAERSFMNLKPEIRERYGNDVGELLELASYATEEEFRREVFGETTVVAAPVVPPSEGSGSAAT